MSLLDTDVLVDCLRGTPAAEAWLHDSANEDFRVPGVAAMALARGERLYTFNLRHYRAISGLDAVEPYERA